PEKAGFVGYGSYDLAVDTLEKAAASASPWLLGERFSAADVYVGSQVDFGLAFKSIPERPAFTAWAERLRGREAYTRAKAIDDALMPAQGWGRDGRGRRRGRRRGPRPGGRRARSFALYARRLPLRGLGGGPAGGSAHLPARGRG